MSHKRDPSGLLQIMLCNSIGWHIHFALTSIYALLSIVLPKRTLEKAEVALLSINKKEYQLQVVSFLAPEYQQDFHWPTVSSTVFQYIKGLM